MNPLPLLKKRWVSITLVVLAVVLIALWLDLTPHGLEGKLRATGYAVCHQLESHSIDFDGRFLPLCARCTGMYLGSLATLSLLQKRKRAAGIPPKAIRAVLIAFLVLFIVDGVNSTANLLPGVPQVYEPNNWLRMATGFLMGMAIGNLLIILWHQSWWKNMSALPALTGWKHLLLIVLVNAVLGVLVWLRIPWLFFPIAILSTGMIVILLSMIYTLIWIIIFKKENSFETYGEGLSFILAGLATAVIQIGLLDLLRYNLTGTWQGFTSLF
jgi:uncharacterized membrane protein